MRITRGKSGDCPKDVMASIAKLGIASQSSAFSRHAAACRAP
jgi:hypothetical protein